MFRSYFMQVERSDALALASGLERIAHEVREVAAHATVLRVGADAPALARLANVLTREVEFIQPALSHVNDEESLAEIIHEMKQIGTEGEHVFYAAVGHLFTETSDALEILRRKDLFDGLAAVLRHCTEFTRVLERAAWA